MIALKKIAEEVTELYVDSKGNETVNERTLRRRFEKLINGCGGDFDKLRNSHGKVFFSEADAPFVKSVLFELADKESISFKLMNSIEDEVLPVKEVDDYVHEFIQLNIDHMEEYNWHEEDIKNMVQFFDLIFEHSIRVKRTYCHELIDYLDYNNQVYPMTFRLEILGRIEKYLQKEYARTAVESLFYMGELSSMLKDAKELTESFDYGDDIIASEYMQRDKKVLEHIQNEPIIRRYIEEKTGRKAEELFSHVIEN